MAKETFDLNLKLEVDMIEKKAKVTDIEATSTNDPKTRAGKILEYLNEQLLITEEEMKASSSVGSFDGDLKLDRMVSQRMYFKLKSIVKSAEKIS